MNFSSLLYNVVVSDVDYIYLEREYIRLHIISVARNL